MLRTEEGKSMRGDKATWNQGVLTSKATPEAQEQYTPYYAVEPILKYISKDKIIWCPFDEEFSAYYRMFTQKGYQVVRSHISEGKDFFYYEPEDYDVIVSNPPFSMKDKILKRLDELGKPFAILLPLNSLQGKRRYQYLKNIQILAFDERIDFHNADNKDKTIKNMCFATCYFCKRILPENLILEHLEKYDRPLE